MFLSITMRNFLFHISAVWHCLGKNEFKTLAIFLIHLFVTSAILTENAQAYLPIDAASACLPNSLYQVHLVKLMLPSKRTPLMSPVTFMSLDRIVFSQYPSGLFSSSRWLNRSLRIETFLFHPWKRTLSCVGEGMWWSEVSHFSGSYSLTLIYSCFLSPNL